MNSVTVSDQVGMEGPWYSLWKQLLCDTLDGVSQYAEGAAASRASDAYGRLQSTQVQITGHVEYHNAEEKRRVEMSGAGWRIGAWC